MKTMNKDEWYQLSKYISDTYKGYSISIEETYCNFNLKYARIHISHNERMNVMTLHFEPRIYPDMEAIKGNLIQKIAYDELLHKCRHHETKICTNMFPDLNWMIDTQCQECGEPVKVICKDGIKSIEDKSRLTK